MRNQWLQGLQWGAFAWLGWVTWQAGFSAFHSSFHGFHAPEVLPAIAWLAAFVLTWTRWSRAGVAFALFVQAVAGTIVAAGYGGEMHLAWALTFWLPMSLPLLPLLFMDPERPRITLTLLAVGRWRDAVAQLAGFRWLAVAAGVMLLNHSGWRALEGLQWSDGRGAVSAFALQALLFSLAAMPGMPHRQFEAW